MRKFIIAAFLLHAPLTMLAQEKAMNILMADGSSSQIRVAELSEISFLSVNDRKDCLLLSTKASGEVKILFESHPVITASRGKLQITLSSPSDTMEYEISDIAEIRFSDSASVNSIKRIPGFSMVVRKDGVLIRGIPQGVVPGAYTTDGISVPLPDSRNGELMLSREALGRGVYVLKVGSFTTKIKL